MPAAVSSVFKTSIALAGASVIAVSPLVPDQDVRVPTVHVPSIELTAAPAIGAIPYQIAVNTIGNLVALAPILIGSTEQCTVPTCFGPTQPPSPIADFPFTGWGAIGIAAGLLGSPIVLVKSLIDGKDFAEAVGASLLAIQAPITNTALLLNAPRIPYGGFELQGVLDRAFIATKHTVDYLVNITAQALVTGPQTVISGLIEGTTTFALTLAQTADFGTAFQAGWAVVKTSIDTAVTDLVNEVDEARTTIYTDLTQGPKQATSPIPTAAAVPVAAHPAAAEESSGPVTKVTDSVKAVPGTTAGSSDDNESGSAAAKSDTSNEGSSASAPKTGKSTGSSKRQHKADSAA